MKYGVSTKYMHLCSKSKTIVWSLGIILSNVFGLFLSIINVRDFFEELLYNNCIICNVNMSWKCVGISRSRLRRVVRCHRNITWRVLLSVSDGCLQAVNRFIEQRKARQKRMHNVQHHPSTRLTCIKVHSS